MDLQLDLLIDCVTHLNGNVLHNLRGLLHTLGSDIGTLHQANLRELLGDIPNSSGGLISFAVHGF